MYIPGGAGRDLRGDGVGIQGLLSLLSISWRSLGLWSKEFKLIEQRI